MTVSLDLNKAKDFITSQKFTDFLINNNTDITIPAFILQTLLDKINECEEGKEDIENGI